MVSFGVLFPGQGSQFVGMGGELFDTMPELLGDRADQVLGWSLRDMCLNGPEDSLTRTEHAQPALFALSYALWSLLAQEIDTPDGGAGHSLGEYTALAAAGAIGYEAALAVVARRGEAMASAADLEPSGMAALLGADEAGAEALTTARRAEGGRLEVANINAPGQIVVAGGQKDIAWLADNAAGYGARRVVPLKVAGAFHSSFMEPATSEVARALADVTFSAPQFPVWSNTTARPHAHAEMAKTLVRQVVSPVRFTECLSDMAGAGMSAFVHVGPGDVTAGMARRTVEGAKVVAMSEPEHAAMVREAVGTM